MSGHDFCRAFLQSSRKDAKDRNIQLPKHITALRGTTVISNTTYFIEADVFKGEFYHGCCAFEAKQKYIDDIITGKLKLETEVRQ